MEKVIDDEWVATKDSTMNGAVREKDKSEKMSNV